MVIHWSGIKMHSAASTLYNSSLRQGLIRRIRILGLESSLRSSQPVIQYNIFFQFLYSVKRTSHLELVPKTAAGGCCRRSVALLWICSSDSEKLEQHLVASLFWSRKPATTVIGFLKWTINALLVGSRYRARFGYRINDSYFDQCSSVCEQKTKS